MGWGLILNEIYLNKVRKDELPNKLEEHNETIKRIREQIMVIAGMSPMDVTDDSGFKMNWSDWVQMRLSEMLDDMEDASVNKFLVEHALSNPDNVTSDF